MRHTEYEDIKDKYQAKLQEYEYVRHIYHGCEEWWMTEEDARRILFGDTVKKGWLNIRIGNNGYAEFWGDKYDSERYMILHVKALDLNGFKLKCDAKDPVIVFHQSDNKT